MSILEGEEIWMLRTFRPKWDLEHERDPGKEPRSETL